MLVALAGVFSLGSAGTVSAQEDASVDIVDFAFDASSITIEAGSTVTWTNLGDATHTVTADDGTFDSGELAGGETFSFTFDEPGTYTYHCGIHPDMIAEIIVTDAATATGDDTDDDSADDDTADDDAADDDSADDDAADDTGDDDTQLPSTGAGTAAPHDAPYALLAVALVLAAGGLLATRRSSTR
jgi:plastocyanin